MRGFIMFLFMCFALFIQNIEVNAETSEKEFSYVYFDVGKKNVLTNELSVIYPNENFERLSGLGNANKTKTINNLSQKGFKGYNYSIRTTDNKTFNTIKLSAKIYKGFCYRIRAEDNKTLIKV